MVLLVLQHIHCEIVLKHLFRLCLLGNSYEKISYLSRLVLRGEGDFLSDILLSRRAGEESRRSLRGLGDESRLERGDRDRDRRGGRVLGDRDRSRGAEDLRARFLGGDADLLFLGEEDLRDLLRGDADLFLGEDDLRRRMSGERDFFLSLFTGGEADFSLRSFKETG